MTTGAGKQERDNDSKKWTVWVDTNGDRLNDVYVNNLYYINIETNDDDKGEKKEPHLNDLLFLSPVSLARSGLQSPNTLGRLVNLFTTKANMVHSNMAATNFLAIITQQMPWIR